MHKLNLINLENMCTALIWLISLAMFSFFTVMIGQFFIKGLDGFSIDFLLLAPESAGRVGGINSIIVSTFLILLICMSAAIPIGLATAIFLAEFSNRNPAYSKLIRVSLDILAGVPSIIFGLFGSAFFCKTLGLGFSILAGGLTLSCMVLPILIRSIEIGLKSVAHEERIMGAALALSKTTILFKLILPAARPGLLMGFILGLGRAIAETAALIFTSGYVDRMPSSLMDSGRALSVHIFDLAMNVPGGDQSAYKSTVVILVIVLIINWAATSLADRWVGDKMERSCKI